MTLIDHRVSCRLIIFDFDGTLADTFPRFLVAMERVTEQFGLRKIEPEDLPKVRQWSAREVMRHLQIPLWKAPMIARVARTAMAENREEIRLFPGINRMLERLSNAGIVLAIVSSNSTQNIRAVLGEENGRCISHFECGASLFGKAEKFRKVLEKTGIPARDTVTIGDEIRDCEAARKVPIRFGAVTWGYTVLEGLKDQRPDYLFESADQIGEMFAPNVSKVSKVRS